ncbi:phospholipase-like protein [Artemisia annua]|uniref:Phospholipase-like protein n=1 Tax=Artemisia annua TaxID=35608 RepID=A0A2U1NWQ6_ARTAN|nr:phospholipase-like protein [Artemisia annua]
MFRNTVLGPWLDLKSEDHDNHVLNFMLQHQKHIENASFETPMYFEIDKHTLEFGRREFCLLTGLRFSKISLEHLEESVSGFCERVFPGFERIKGYDLIRVLQSESFNKMSNEDVVRLCMLLAVEYVLKGQELRHVLSNELLCLVDDFYAWDAFPWGEYIWMEFHNRVYNVLSKKREEHLLEFVKVGPSYKAHYPLYGFVFALKIFVLESFQVSKLWWKTEDNVFPRCVAWSDYTKFKNSDYNRMFYSTTPIKKLRPTPIEKQSLWWQSSIEFFQQLETSNIQNTKPLVRRKFAPKICRSFVTKRVKQEVMKEVKHENRVKPQVMKDVKHEMRAPVEEEADDEEEEVNEEVVDKGLNGLSKAALVKKVADMERELTNYKTISTCLTAIEELLKPHSVHTFVQKVESIGLKIGEALTRGENSVIASNGVKGFETGCNNLVDNDEVVRKESDVSVDLSESVNNRNLVDVCVSVSNTLKDAYEGVKKHKHALVDEWTEGKVVQTGTNVGNNCVSKPFGGDTAVECKTVCVDKFVTTVSTDHGFGHNASQDNNAYEMMQVEEEVQDICPSPSEGLVAVEALMDLISFTPPSENSNWVNDMERDNIVENLQVNDDMADVEIISSCQNHPKVKTVQVPFARERKKSVYLQDPFTDPPPTTPRVRRRRKKKVYKKPLKTLVGSDGKVIELQPWNENLIRPKGSPANRVNTFRDINLVLRTEKDLYYSFPWADNVVDWTFWSALLCKGGNRRGWLSDAVYFPVNETEVHWVLAELDICSGVITLFDSLGGPRNPNEDGRPWWEKWRKVLAEHLPLYLYESEVLQRKNIDPSSYYITFRWAQNLPIQGPTYGDCGVWLCIFLYRLTHELSLDASDPVEVALAYREQLTAFY